MIPALFAVTTVACALPAPEAGGPMDENERGGASGPTLSGQMDAQDPQAWSFHVRLQRAASIRVTCDEVEGDQERHVKTFNAQTSHQGTIRGLKASTTYRCEASTVGAVVRRSDSVTFTTAALPVELTVPLITVPSADVAATGYTLYAYGIYRAGFKNNYLVILDAKGHVRWYLPGPGAGDIDATWLGDDRILYGGMSASFHPPTIVGLDKAVRWQGTTAVASLYEQAGETNHDVGLSEDGTSIFHLNYEQLDDFYETFSVKQIDLATNEVLWSWSSIEDGIDAGDLPSGGDFYDPYHANSIDDQWENGRLYLYVGLRNLHRVLKIDYLTREVVWQLGVDGDFTLLEADGTPATADGRWFFNQHDVKLYGPNLMAMHDNGTERGTYGSMNYSRALQLELDEEAMTARIVFEYREDKWEEPWWGGYDLLPDGNSLIAMGHLWGFTEGHYSALVELDPAGQVVWRADFRTDRDAIYRADRIDGCDIFDNVQYCPDLE